ncbi:Gfo/Idh/MocA family protein [Rhizohabitans arisaemae]|uniref:Gfo/Idh/MocA family protein n=1 Tax=Rhizohabitans arisaemae TaxID=2720610 RepID=UPI0024B17209|nr:Gfo/Idh/MocA family oxidoreductase [Rhizohabitans arisaemae]
MSLTVAVVGAGAFGARHVAAYASLGVRVGALVDPDPAVRENLASAFGVPRTFARVEELIEAVRPEAASVCSPGHAHRDAAVTLMTAGIPVLVEKPLADTVRDAEEIVAVSESTGVLCQPGHILRFSAPHRALYDALRAGELGEVLAVSSRRDRSRALSRLYPGAHPAMLTAVHDIDLALWYSGSPVTEVRAVTQSRSGAVSPVLVWAELRHESGVVSSIRNAYLLPESSPNPTSDLVEVYGSGGVGHVDLAHPTLLVQAERTQAPDWLISPPGGGGALAAELRHFLDRVAGAQPPETVRPADGLHVVRVAAALIDSAEAGGAHRRLSPV